MHRMLSTRYTALLKFVLPPIWIGLVIFAVWQLLITPEAALLDGETVAARPIIRWLLLALLAASLVVLFAFVLPLKRVELTPEGVRVSNYRRAVTVPFRAIARVRQNWLPTFRMVTLELRKDAAIGRRVIFMPAGRLRMAFWRADYWREDDLVGELRRLAGLTTDSGSGLAV